MLKISLVYFDCNTGRTYTAVHHGLAYLIGALKREGHAVFMNHLENEDGYDTLARSIKEQNADIIGLSFTTNQKRYVRRFFESCPVPHNRMVLAGGVHCTLLKEQVFEDFPRLEGICVGDGEAAFSELCRRIEAGSDHLTVPGFYFKQKGRIIKNQAAPLFDIDPLAPPDYSFFYSGRNFEAGGGYHQMLVSRGCPYRCHHCCNHVLREVYPNPEKYVRFFSPKRALEIVKLNLAASPGTRVIGFVDDLFTWDRQWLGEFCSLYKKEAGLPFVCCSLVDLMDDKTASCLKEAGCVVVNFGLESGSEWLRRSVMNRKHSNKTIADAFAVVRKHGIKTHSYSMFGFPFETARMQRETVELNLRIRPDSGTCHYFYPYPCTRLFQLCRDFDLLAEGYEDRSGYFESPAVSQRHALRAETEKNFQTLQLYFYIRMVFSGARIPVFLERFIFRLVSACRKAIFPFFNITTRDSGVRKFILYLRRMGLRVLFNPKE